MDQIKSQIEKLNAQFQDLNLRFNKLGTLPGITQDQQGALANRLFKHATASPSTYVTVITGGVQLMSPADGFYELEPGIYVPFFRRKT